MGFMDSPTHIKNECNIVQARDSSILWGKVISCSLNWDKSSGTGSEPFFLHETSLSLFYTLCCCLFPGGQTHAWKICLKANYRTLIAINVRGLYCWWSGDKLSDEFRMLLKYKPFPLVFQSHMVWSAINCPLDSSPLIWRRGQCHSFRVSNWGHQF